VPLALALLAAAIGAGCDKPAGKQSPATARPPDGPAAARDWKQHPAVVEMDLPADLYALGDVHGDYDRLAGLLDAAGLIAKGPERPLAYRWAGGPAVLVCTGDLIDRYDQSLRVIALMRTLQPQAAAAGGRVVVTLGNHEAEFLAAGGAPQVKKGAAFADELRAAGISPAAVAAGRDPGGIGAWLRDLPVAARAGDWFFCHAGNTGGRTLAALESDVEQGVDAGGFAAPVLLDPNSILEARLHPRQWWDAEPDVTLKDVGPDAKDDAVPAKSKSKAKAAAAGVRRLRAGVEALGARHLVFGHQPGAVDFADGSERAAGEVVAKFDGLVFLLDTGMSRGVDNGRGALLHVTRRGDGGGVTATAVYADGKAAPLWP
jgi:hypothetical protein